VDEWELFDLQSDPQERTNLYLRPEAKMLRTNLETQLNQLRGTLRDNQ
jgi:hypothetical protein